MAYARAHVNWGRWIATCPNPDCNNAEEIHPTAKYECGHRGCSVAEFPQAIFHCSCCFNVAPIEWPPDPEVLWRELQQRPKSENRNWYPAEHELAIKWDVPHGQTVADLRAETIERSR